MQQFFLAEPLEAGRICTLSDAQAHHARDVLKLSHETVRVVSQGAGFFGEVYTEGKAVRVRVLARDPYTHELPVEVTLAPALIRREPFEWMLQKAVELGVSRIVPFISHRSVVHVKEGKIARWRTILESAACQSRRNIIPTIAPAVPLRQVDAFSSACLLVPYEKESEKGLPLKSALHGSSLTVFIGPEGGFDSEEIAFLKARGCTPVSLGPRILRAETASLFALSVIASWSEGQ